MLTVIESVKTFLNAVPINYAKDLTDRISLGMETQIMVDPGCGEPVYVGQTLKRNTWQLSDSEYGTYEYHHIRIPKNSMSDPHFTDYELRFPLFRHIECIGMTGWDWEKKRSRWVAFDFDSITGHAAGVGVTDEVLEKIKTRACSIPWVQVRRSTGGSGLHLYVYFDPDVDFEVENHHVHAAVARAVLGIMEREAAFDFSANMDVFGGNMWIWHRKINQTNEGLSILRSHMEYCPPLPSNWRDNLDVVRGISSKVRIQGVASNEAEWESFEQQASARASVTIDDVHKRVEERIIQLGYSIIWVPDHNCWQTHTRAFKDLMERWPDDYVGVFDTLSVGNDKGKPNCFAFPLENGGFRITRFGRGAKEHEIWNQNQGDWTWTYFNRPPDLREAAMIMGGNENSKGTGWVFTNIEDARKVVRLLGGDFRIDESWANIFGKEDRKITLAPNPEGNLVVSIEKRKDDKPLPGWVAEGRSFVKLIRQAVIEQVSERHNDFDKRIRALVAPSGDFAAWVVYDNIGTWVGHNKDNIRSVLNALACEDIESTMGTLVLNAWRLVSVPFQPEYIGNRQWNRNAPQFSVAPGEPGTRHPHWDMILDHCGQDLDEALSTTPWAKDNGIQSGADYLLLWICCMVREPFSPLPYLFFYGPQNSGKSIFHEAISLLMTGGVILADEALKNQNGFNGELANSVLCVVEETNLSKSDLAYNRLKAWVTGENILIHAKRQQPYQLRNTTHWVQCANELLACPIFPGDTRITMLYVPLLQTIEIPKPVLMQKLREESPAFLRTILEMKLPPSPGRLRIPVLSNESKLEAEVNQYSALEVFIREQCHRLDGAILKVAEFYEAFILSLPSDVKYEWTYNRVCSSLRERQIVPTGKALNNILCAGNISLEPPKPGMDYGNPWIRTRTGKLIRKD